jgi:hypothetical protein
MSITKVNVHNLLFHNCTMVGNTMKAEVRQLTETTGTNCTEFIIVLGCVEANGLVNCFKTKKSGCNCGSFVMDLEFRKSQDLVQIVAGTCPNVIVVDKELEVVDTDYAATAAKRLILSIVFGIEPLVRIALVEHGQMTMH